MILIRDRSHDVANWVAANIPHMGGQSFGLCAAIGVADEREILAGVVYHDWQPHYGTMQISIAAISPRWASRGTVLELLAYPFDEVGVNKLWSAIPVSNERAIKFNLGIGFSREAVLARHFGRDHAVITRMFCKNYLKLREKWNGQAQIRTAA